MEKRLCLLKNYRINETEKKLISITWPIFIESALFMLLGSVDIFMLGRFSDNAVAAVGVANQIIGMLNLVFQIITAGTTIICAQYIGAKAKNENIIKLVGTSLIVNILLGVILSLIMIIFSKPLLLMMNLDESLLGYGESYLKIVGGFIFIQAITMTFTAVIRSFGFTKVCMFVTLGMNIYNIISNYILIYGNFGAPAMGVAGSAISTTLSKLFGGIFLGYFMFKHTVKGFSLKYFKEFPRTELRNIIKMGGPAAGESISYNLAKLVGTVILTYVSIESLTTSSYINNIASFIYLFSVSIGQGTSIIVGQLVGKKDYDTAYDLCIKSFKKAFLVSIVIGITVAIFGKNIMSIFTDNSVIISLGMSVLIVNAFLEPGRTFNVVIINCLRAAGDVKFPVYIGIVSMWLIGVGLAYILSITLGLGIVGMWIALALDEWVRGIIMYNRWKSRKWLGKALV